MSSNRSRVNLQTVVWMVVCLMVTKCQCMDPNQRSRASRSSGTGASLHRPRAYTCPRYSPYTPLRPANNYCESLTSLTSRHTSGGVGTPRHTSAGLGTPPVRFGTSRHLGFPSRDSCGFGASSGVSGGSLYVHSSPMCPSCSAATCFSNAERVGSRRVSRMERFGGPCGGRSQSTSASPENSGIGGPDRIDGSRLRGPSHRSVGTDHIVVPSRLPSANVVDPISGRGYKLRRYKGKVLLIVVTATFHAHSPQLIPLNTLQEKYEGGLKILAFPCNQFRVTENGSNYTEIINIMYYVRPGKGFVPKFDVFGPGPVNGASEAPLFTYLKDTCPPTRIGFTEPLTDLKYEPLRNSDVREPYEKFLVGARGYPVARYDASVEPSELEPDIVEELMKREERE
ncbi:uncharacterized protein LOC103509202 [Diaphorina citri]|uniref:Glutathione peroxidase n=1 Tax=Diaphorina citri TaxID=121845 RepID=A0A3Q0IT08_DIACI|nr:uncharacterized protein LOC103509202 [Diaphorina citri]